MSDALTTSEQTRGGYPNWVWAALGALAAYMTVMYAGLARVYLHYSAVGFPWILSQPGYSLYINVTDQHAPGSTWLNTLLFSILPAHELRVRLSMIIVVIICMVLIFWLARRWWGLAAGLIGAASFAFWGTAIMDRPMYYDVLLGVAGLAALAFWYRHDSHWRRPLMAGLIVGLAITVKQHALALVVAFAVWRMSGFDWRAALKDLGIFVSGAAILPAATTLIFAAQGRLAEAWFWQWTFNLTPGYYSASAVQGVATREAILLIGWLALAPLFMLAILPDRRKWSRQDLLLLGLLPALMTPAFPRYGRFHLSGAVPVAALISAGAYAYLWRTQSGWRRRAARLYLAGCGLLLIIAAMLPIYYRLRLGPRTGEYEALIPIRDWLYANTDVAAGSRVWIMPASDPTDNFYAVGEFLPPTYVSQTYSWFHRVPGQTERVLHSLESEPPQYAILIERWRPEIPGRLLDYLDAHYEMIGESEIGFEYGLTTFYQLRSAD